MDESIQFKTYQETLRAKNAYSCNALLSRLVKHHSEAIAKPAPVILIKAVSAPAVLQSEVPPQPVGQGEDIPEPKLPSVQEIKICVAQYFKLLPHELESPRRFAKIVLPRQIAFYLARKLTNRSLPDIGRRFGGKDHTTILHACKKMKERMEADPLLAQTVRCLEEQLQ